MDSQIQRDRNFSRSVKNTRDCHMSITIRPYFEPPYPVEGNPFEFRRQTYHAVCNVKC